MSAKERYDYLSSYRSQFLDVGIECAKLTLPYLLTDDISRSKGANRILPTPWQSVGAKGVGALASKLMLALLPPQTSFFKLQVDEGRLGELATPEIKTELDQSFAKLEKQVMDNIAASTDRVVIHQAIKHLVVVGNALIYMGDDGLKTYPLNRYVVDRDGNGNVTEIVTKECISRKMIPDLLPNLTAEIDVNRPGDDGQKQGDEEVEIYTHVIREGKKWRWHQEIDGVKIKSTISSANDKTNPWLVLRFNTVDGECFGRGRVEEFLGDLRSLEGLMQAMVEGSAIAARVIFLLNPGCTTRPATIAAAPNGGVVPGKPDDLVAVQVGKAMDFRTTAEMIGSLERRLSEAFLILSVRQSERTTAEEVRMTQFELEQQLGGLFSLLTVELLIPYLNRKLSVLEKSKEIKKIPEGLAKITIVAGVNALGRGQDRESLTQFLGTIGQTLGPEALQQYVDTLEVTKRLAVSLGIDVLNLIKTPQQVTSEKEEGINLQKEMSLTDQAGSLASAPMMDPSKNPQLSTDPNGESIPNQANASPANQV